MTTPLSTSQKLLLSVVGAFLLPAVSHLQMHLNDPTWGKRFWLGATLAGLYPVATYLMGFYQINPVNQPHTTEAILRAVGELPPAEAEALSRAIAAAASTSPSPSTEAKTMRSLGSLLALLSLLSLAACTSSGARMTPAEFAQWQAARSACNAIDAKILSRSVVIASSATMSNTDKAIESAKALMQDPPEVQAADVAALAKCDANRSATIAGWITNIQKLHDERSQTTVQPPAQVVPSAPIQVVPSPATPAVKQ